MNIELFQLLRNFDSDIVYDIFSVTSEVLKLDLI